MGLETLLLNSLPGSKPGLEKIVELNRKLVSDLRGLSRTLNLDSSLAKGLDEALRQQIVLINQLGTIKASIDVHASIPKISQDKLTIIYRICQEALQNSLKHGNAKQITINMDISKNNLILSIEDDGEGFLVDAVNRGSGIDNMASRAKLLGGRISIDSKPKKGTSVHIIVPINPSK
jgi:signal transduction histidine kinase